MTLGDATAVNLSMGSNKVVVYCKVPQMVYFNSYYSSFLIMVVTSSIEKIRKDIPARETAQIH